MVLGEGAGVVVLEELATAQARGARIYAEVVGAGSSQATDRNYVARRDVALANVIRKSLAEAGIARTKLATSMPTAWRPIPATSKKPQRSEQTFGEAATRIPVTAVKSYFGNLGPAAGSVELIASVLALANNRLPPILNYETPDPECPITPADRRACRSRHAASSISA